MLKEMTVLADELYLTTATRVLFAPILKFPTINLIKFFCSLKTVGVTPEDESNRKTKSALGIRAGYIPKRNSLIMRRICERRLGLQAQRKDRKFNNSSKNS